MDRRRVLSVLAGMAVTGAVRAQPRAKPVRIGYLMTSETAQGHLLKDEFRRALTTLGYVEGRDFVLEVRSAPSWAPCRSDAKVEACNQYDTDSLHRAFFARAVCILERTQSRMTPFDCGFNRDATDS